MSAMIIHKEYFHHYSMTFIKDNSNLTITKSSTESSTEQALETTSLNPTDMIRKESVLPCPPIPPQLQGKVVLNMNSTSWSNLSSDLSDVHILSGGEFTPNCSTEHRGSLEKKILLGLSNTFKLPSSYHSATERNTSRFYFRIFILCCQDKTSTTGESLISWSQSNVCEESLLFLRKMISCSTEPCSSMSASSRLRSSETGTALVKIHLYSLFTIDSPVFHDVDLIPEDDRNLYTCSHQPRHLSAAVDTLGYKLPYPGLFGGASAMTGDQMRRVNGFSNQWWGWGGEDDDMTKRLSANNYTIIRYQPEIARY